MTPEEGARTKFYSEKVAELTKILDRREAGLLVFAFVLYPKDIINDLCLIEEAIKHSDFESIFDLLCWYQDKSMAVVAKVKFFQPKKKLHIFKYRPATITSS